MVCIQNIFPANWMSTQKGRTRIMNGSKKMVFTALGFAIVATFGCADNDVVKKEEPVAGERRAKLAQHYLVALGVPAGRLSVISYGKEHPAVQGNNEAAWEKNRRDDFVVQK